jgi:hypothetical protein
MMVSRRFEGSDSVHEYASSARFLSGIKGKYSLPGVKRKYTLHGIRGRYTLSGTRGKRRFPGIRTIIGLGSRTKKGITRYDKSFGLKYADIPSKRPNRYLKCVNDLNIAINLAGITHHFRTFGYPLESRRAFAESNQSELAGQQEMPGRREEHYKYVDQRTSAEKSGAVNGVMGHLMPSNLVIERKSLMTISKRIEWIEDHFLDSVDRKLQASGLRSRMIAWSMKPPGAMISMKYMHSSNIGSISSEDAGTSRSRSFTEFESVPADSSIGSGVGKEEAFRPIYRTIPAREALTPSPVTTPGKKPDATESVQFAPSAQDLNRISDQVCSIMERKLLIERERRGIYG